LRPEAWLFEQAQTGYQDSLNLLMARHAGLVVAAVNRQNLGDLPRAEADQAGRIGLWRAIQGYDPGRGYRFATYAYPAIVHHVWAAVKAHCVANRQAHAHREWRVFFRAWEVGLAQRQAEGEVVVSLQALVGRLPLRLAQIIQGRYGLAGARPQTLAEVGARLGLSGERVRQLQGEALIWLRHPAHSQELRGLLQRHSQREYEWAEQVAQAWRGRGRR
jgi:RNA polymerase sigma factor (sigma-70 family)